MFMFHARKHESVDPEAPILLVIEPVSLFEDPVIFDYIGQRLAVVPSHAHVPYVVGVHPVNSERE